MELILFSETLAVSGLHHSIYKCDSRFETDPIRQLLTSHAVYGVIAIDRNCCTIGQICGDSTKVLCNFSDDLPNRHRKGGQSAPRFQRLRLERRGAYVTKAAEKADSLLLKDDQPTVAGVFLAGCAELRKSF